MYTAIRARLAVILDVPRPDDRVSLWFDRALIALILVNVVAVFLESVAAQPAAFSNIPQAMRWAIVTVTTVGYGEVVPETAPGKLLGAALGIVGVGMVALPAGILASGFSNALHRRQSDLRRDVDAYLADGHLDDDERHRLASRAQSLSLSSETVEDMIQDETAARRCPHCGRRLHGD